MTPTKTMKGRRLIGAAAIAIALLVAYNVAIELMSRSSLRQQFFRRLATIPDRPGVIFFGNSLVEAGCRPAEFAAAWPGDPSAMPLNLGLAETTPVEHYLILHEALQRTHGARLLVYGFYDDQLSAPVGGDWDELIGNRALSYYFPAEAAGLYAPGSAWKRWQLEIGRYVPMLGERTSVWKRVERWRHAFEDFGLPNRKRNQFGDVDDFAALVAHDVPSFVRRCDAILARHAGFSRPVQEILRLARAHGATVVLVEMPMPRQHHEMFYSTAAWKRLRSHLQGLAHAAGALYLPASDWVCGENKFDDTVHLNAAGAREFSERLAIELARLQAKPASVTGTKPTRDPRTALR